MKVFKRSIPLLLMVISIVNSSCSSKDDSVDGINNSGFGTFTAKINGENFQSLPELATAAVFTDVEEGVRILSLSGQDDRGRQIGISVGSFNGEGSYTLLDPNNPDDYSGGVAIYMEGEGENAQVWMLGSEGAQPGRLHITNYVPNEVLEGTFYFDVYNPYNETSKSVRDGVFKVIVISM